MLASGAQLLLQARPQFAEQLLYHHVRDDIGAPLGWDLAFLAFGALLIALGAALVRSVRFQ